MNFILTIWEEMLKGNFSFAILIVGIITMRINDVKWKKEEMSWQGGLCPPSETQIGFGIFCF